MSELSKFVVVSGLTATAVIATAVFGPLVLLGIALAGLAIGVPMVRMSQEDYD